MSCQECDRLRAKLSPLEDPDFTAEYRLVEPVEWLRGQELVYDKAEAVGATLPDIFFMAFSRYGNNSEITKLGRTLLALGWSRTKRNGILYYVMGKEEFEHVYGRA